MQILENHMSSLSFSTNEVIVSRARAIVTKTKKNSMTEIIVCILLTSNHMQIWNKWYK